MRFRIAGTCLALLVLLLGEGVLHAELKVLRVDPQQTGSAIEAVHGPHLAVYDPQTPSRHRLFLFLVGTGERAASNLKMDSTFAKWGYHAISLDYENTVVAASLSHSHDDTVFDHYREAIVTGAPVSASIKVDRANSILNRIQKLLIYLAKNDPNGGWGEFLAHDAPAWNHIIVAGHSQGSGHAAYIGKIFKVDRVLIFSGPQDYLTDLDKPAPWLSRESATPPSRFFAFLSQTDPFNVHHQIANCMALMNMSKPSTATVEPGEKISGHYQILINDLPTKSPHGSTLLPQFENVWHYMVTAATR